MSRHEQQREDLLREATALVERIELKIASHTEPIFIGFRPDAAASFYFGQDRVYHFNAAGQLRRAYLAGQLYKAHQTRLIALDRRRTTTETVLLSQAQSPDQTAAILANLQSLLTELKRALASDAYTITGQVPAAANIIPRIQSWLGTYLPTIAIADRPNVAQKAPTPQYPMP